MDLVTGWRTLPPRRSLLLCSLVVTAVASGCTGGSGSNGRPSASRETTPSAMQTRMSANESQVAVTVMPGDPEGRAPAAGGKGKIFISPKRCLHLRIAQIGEFIAVLPDGYWKLEGQEFTIYDASARLDETILISGAEVTRDSVRTPDVCKAEALRYWYVGSVSTV